jgi:diketogulonate reductase-like aldo/keto reductase
MTNVGKYQFIIHYIQFFTKWVPQPGGITKGITAAAIDRSLKRMGTDSLDLLQFNWFPYQNKNYFNAMFHLQELKEAGKIKNIGLTNFDTEHMALLIDSGAPIVSNQVMSRRNDIYHFF